MKFTHLYENLKLLDICKPVSKEEAEKRDEEAPAIKLKEIIDNAEKTKLPDGTWHVHGDLDITELRLSSLKDLKVSIVDGYFDCSENTLTSLEGCPKTINGKFSCAYNKLTSLEGGPMGVVGSFFCNNNKLTSLEGCPTEVKRNFECSSNYLTSLKGSPNEIGKDFYCDRNRLTSLEGCPKVVRGGFFCYNNIKIFTEDEIKALCDVKGNILG